MSTTLESFETDDDTTCPHGIEGVDDELIRCWYCWNEAQSGEMALNDPRREA